MYIAECVVFEQCTLGCKGRISNKPHRKATRLMSNSKHIREALTNGTITNTSIDY